METEDDKGQSVQDPVDDTGQSDKGQTLDDPNQQKQEPTDDNLPEKFKGKTAVEIAEAHLELEKKLGEKDLDIKQLQDDLDDVVFEKRYSQQANQVQQQQGNPQQQTLDNQPFQSTAEGEEAEEYIQIKDINKFVDSRLQNVLGKTQQMTQQVSQQVNYHEPVIEKARRESPQVFKDVSNDEVKAQVFNQLSAGQLNDSYLTNTNLYKDIARRVQDAKTNYGQTAPNVTQAASPVVTEDPASTKPLETEGEGKAIPQDALTKEMLKFRPKDMSEKDFLKKVSHKRETFGESPAD